MAHLNLNIDVSSVIATWADSFLINRVGIVSRIDRRDAVDFSLKVGGFLEKKGIQAIFESDLAKILGKEGEALDVMNVDLVITLGGDGTILRTLHAVEYKIPIFPINMGSIGFLADVYPKDALGSIEKVLKGSYIQDKCYTLATNLELPFALNEVRIGTELPQQMVELGIAINGVQIAKDKVDAIIVATTTGSSAYALSAGANVIDPRLDALIIVPVCALSANFRPYVVPSHLEVSIKPESPSDLMALADGRYQHKIPQGTEIKIQRSNESAVIYRIKENFYDRLRRRLGSSSLPS